MDYEKMSVTLLRQECKKYGIQASGKKKNEMVECLIKYHEDNKGVEGELKNNEDVEEGIEEEVEEGMLDNKILKKEGNKAVIEEDNEKSTGKTDSSKKVESMTESLTESEEEKIRLRKLRFGTVDAENTNSVYIERKKPGSKQKSISVVKKEEIKKSDETKSKDTPVFSEEEIKKIEERKKRFATN
ncbi:hypothetical protein CWI37_0052p0030 [Hamiltosporidium tvaerminnensis]|uniref:SAP domain-containing protein n=1 Tax=Hamiltosporidium tvaerminnensis TaxID=1176355 RepID=A0A4Q9LB88_9MICR|nr:hypothetical protein LUQ84_001840 [Hamiltosporidium tvaerminnensis]TBU05077.1 hypothetical protein CWI37_0052p0030 [Hamiltosporidium tvaerminnensis]